MKLLLYCTKAKPYLYYAQESRTLMEIDNSFEGYKTTNKNVDDTLNGKIVAECDFEVEEIEYDWYPYNKIPNYDHYFTYFHTKKVLTSKEFYDKSCLNWDKLNQYLCDYDSQVFEGGYATHIKNLHVFDTPLELNNFLYEDDTEGHYGVWEVERAPANYTIIATDVKDIGGVYCCRGTYGRFLALSSREFCDILNGKKTIVVRKRLSKEIL